MTNELEMLISFRECRKTARAKENISTWCGEMYVDVWYTGDIRSIANDMPR